MGDCHLYLGFRNKDKDYYYQEDWQRMLQKGVLASQGGLVTAFSRDQEKKVYVTHLLAQNAAQLYGLIQQVRLASHLRLIKIFAWLPESNQCRRQALVVSCQVLTIIAS